MSPAQPTQSSSAGTLAPREHGAWGVLFSAVVIGIAAGGWRPETHIPLALAVVPLYLCAVAGATWALARISGRELEVDRGHVKRLWAQAVAGLALAVIGVRAAPVVLWFGLPLGLALAVKVVADDGGHSRSLSVQLAGASAMCLVLPAFALAGARPEMKRVALLLGLLVLHHIANVIHVRTRVSQTRDRRRLTTVGARLRHGWLTLALHAAVMAWSALIVVAGAARWPLLLAGLPGVARTVSPLLRPPGKWNIRAVGWREVGNTVAFALVTAASVW